MVNHQGRLPVAGADLFYEAEGAGTPVVLLHGFSLDGRMWDAQMPALRDIATVVRVDLRGFGRLRPSPHAQLEQITAPTTVVVGELDVPRFRI